jgi:putative two-component system response regulator
MVDDNIINLTLGKSILSQQYDLFTVPSGEKFFKLLEKVTPDIILLDIEMPEMSGYDIIKRLKTDKKTADIPVIFLTVRNDNNSELEGLNMGAVDYIVKPFSPALLLKRIEIHLLLESQKKELLLYNRELEQLVDKKTNTILAMRHSTLNMIVDLVEFRDMGNKGHLERTYQYLDILVKNMIQRNVYWDDLKTWNIGVMLQSSQLHDIGKISIRDAILLKPSRLTDEEFEEMKKHTVYGVQIIEKLEKDYVDSDFLIYAKLFAGSHHERWDGNGYPKKLAGEAIPLQGRLMAIADVYDSLTSYRPYNTVQKHEDAVQYMKRGSGSQFDPILLELFLSVSGEFEKVLKDCT